MADKLSQKEIDDFLAAHGFYPAANPNCADHITALADVSNDIALSQCLRAINNDRADGQPELPVFDFAAFRQEVEKYRAAQASPPVAPVATPAAPVAAPPAGPPGPTGPGAPAAPAPQTKGKAGKVILALFLSFVTLGMMYVGWIVYWGRGEVAEMPESDKPTVTAPTGTVAPSAQKPLSPVAATRLTCTNAYGRVHSCSPVPPDCSMKLLEHLVFECAEGKLSSLATRIEIPNGAGVQIPMEWTPN